MLELGQSQTSETSGLRNAELLRRLAMLPRCTTVEICKSRNFSRRRDLALQSIFRAIGESLGGIERNREFPL